MKSQRVWLLLVSLLLMCGMIGCGEKRGPVVEEPKPLASEQEVTEKPKTAMEKPEKAIAPFDADQAEKHQHAWAEYLGVPVEITNSIGMKLRLIPAGEFVMGSPESEVNRLDNEYQHRVRITKPFYLGRYEVTQAEYERVMKTNPSWFSSGGDGKEKVHDLGTSRLPVEEVSWDDAVEFCHKLSQLPEEKAAGRIYRLPTEAEWEYACRAGTTTPFHFGSELNGSQANCVGTRPYGTSTEGASLGLTTRVGSYAAANAFGLYDMHGNVWEWCNDWYAGEYYTSSPENDPLGPTEATFRVIRGGCWRNSAWDCRAAFRRGFEPANRDDGLGFRVAANPSGE